MALRHFTWIPQHPSQANKAALTPAQKQKESGTLKKITGLRKGRVKCEGNDISYPAGKSQNNQTSDVLSSMTEVVPKKSFEAPSVRLTSVDKSGHLTLEGIRDSLVRQEDSIIFNLIERAQYKMNSAAYDPNKISVPGFNGSLLEYMLRETETLHGKVRRYTVPGEHPFFPEVVPDIILPALTVPKVLHSGGAKVSLNPLIWKMYFDDLLPALVSPGDDSNYGSVTTMDVLCLQALSKRIHFGAFVAEAKFRESPELYEPLIRSQDKEGLMRLLTFPVVEERVVQRVALKATSFAKDIDLDKSPSAQARLKIDPFIVSNLYKDWIMPLTKQVQVEYLMRRLDPE